MKLSLQITRFYESQYSMVALAEIPKYPSDVDNKVILSGLTPDGLADLQSEFQTIASQIRDFRMKNFPGADEE